MPGPRFLHGGGVGIPGMGHTREGWYVYPAKIWELGYRPTPPVLSTTTHMVDKRPVCILLECFLIN